ncbi:MAG: HAD family phosphatase [Actinomycetes bacterium]
MPSSSISVAAARSAVRPRAILFDMDGLLVETESTWHRAESSVMAEVGVAWTQALAHQFVGGPISQAAEIMAGIAGHRVSAAEIETSLVDLMEHLLVTEPIHWRPGARELLVEAAYEEIPCALVSNSYRRLMNAVLVAIETDLGRVPFSTTVAADELSAGKPSPIPYLTAAARLECRPEDCVVLEDSSVGVTAGLAAGARVVGVPNVVPLEPQPGLVIVSSLAEVSLADLRALFMA